MACVLIYVLARREASFHLDDVVYAAALTIGCGRKDLCEPGEISSTPRRCDPGQFSKPLLRELSA